MGGGGRYSIDGGVTDTTPSGVDLSTVFTNGDYDSTWFTALGQDGARLHGVVSVGKAVNGFSGCTFSGFAVAD